MINNCYTITNGLSIVAWDTDLVKIVVSNLKITSY